MKRVTVYTIGQEQREIAGDWLRIRTELRDLHPVLPWNVPAGDSVQALALKDEHAQIVHVRHTEGGSTSERYVAISQDLAELLIPALMPAYQKRLDNEIRNRRAAEAKLTAKLSDAQADAWYARAARDVQTNRISSFLWLPLHKRLWRAWKGQL
jgi:hypothetical protein